MEIITKFVFYCNTNKAINQMKELGILEAILIGLKLTIVFCFIPIIIYLSRLALTI